uniref:Proteinase inhibitor I32, inhibitor of apoptosis,domain-containing protein n=1 Tax=Schistosoma japonicum TaxID=6182 RepID=C1LAF7_SCHJA|nr:Proteinase inhibitor I32, inhibitor of apoptosis,domain-containing protein [Schistosoma japonicum]CAX71685.1 Proteinase inhibitor I32, inhibitor of apoptosis,domain-containing protein [Schistosoma japonicum]
MSYFQNLSNALDDTFSATVQSEDELDYSSATLVLAGLLQIHSRTPRYAFYQARLDSFPKVIHQKDASKESPLYRSQSLVPSPSELASAGFFPHRLWR